MSLTEQQLYNYIDEQLPDNSYTPISKVRDVLKVVVSETIELSGGAITLTKDGYDWKKYNGNNDLENYQLYDIIQGIGTIYPGYWVKAIVKRVSPLTFGIIDSEDLTV